jgi:hypothetical protein
LARTSGQAEKPWNGDLAVAHVGLFDFTGAFRGKRLDAAAFKAALETGWHFIDALPFWMHDETWCRCPSASMRRGEVETDGGRGCEYQPRSSTATSETDAVCTILAKLGAKIAAFRLPPDCCGASAVDGPAVHCHRKFTSVLRL